MFWWAMRLDCLPCLFALALISSLTAGLSLALSCLSARRRTACTSPPQRSCEASSAAGLAGSARRCTGSAPLLPSAPLRLGENLRIYLRKSVSDLLFELDEMAMQLRLGPDGLSVLRAARNLDWGEHVLLEVALASDRVPGDSSVWRVRCGLPRLGNGTMLGLFLDGIEVKYANLPRALADWQAASPRGDFADCLLSTVLLWQNSVILQQAAALQGMLGVTLNDATILTTEFKVMSLSPLSFKPVTSSRTRRSVLVKDVILRSRHVEGQGRADLSVIRGAQREFPWRSPEDIRAHMPCRPVTFTFLSTDLLVAGTLSGALKSRPEQLDLLRGDRGSPQFLPGHVTVLLSRVDDLKDVKTPESVVRACHAAEQVLGEHTVLRLTLFLLGVRPDWPLWLTEVCVLLQRQGLRVSILLIFDEDSVLQATEFMLRECLARFSDMRFIPVYCWIAPSWIDEEGPIAAPTDLETLALDFHFSDQFPVVTRPDDQL